MTGRFAHLVEVAFNGVGTHIPSHRVRQAWLRRLGAEIGERCAIFRGTTVLEPRNLRLGSGIVVGERCLLDATGGEILIEDNVNISSDVVLMTADHDIQSSSFEPRGGSIHVGSRAWLATRSMVLRGVDVGEGAVVAAGAVVIGNVAPFTLVGGVPAEALGERTRRLTYEIDHRPPFE
jgi:acetyltransferase-like isoleucine patch superfamily enzyme